MAIYKTLIAFLGLIIFHEGTASSDMTSRLIHDLVHSYDANVQPDADSGPPTTVSIGLTISDLEEIRSRTDVFKVHGFVSMRWKDSRFSWDPTEFENITEIRLPSRFAWLPDITLFNNQDAKSGIFSEVPKLTVVYPDGTVLWIPPATLPIRCNTTTTDASKESLGEISCKIVLGSWTYNGYQVDVQPVADRIDLSFFSADYFRFTNTSVIRVVKKYDCCVEPYPSIVMSFTASRVKEYR
jgi:nicotinic acetylcholine receptor